MTKKVNLHPDDAREVVAEQDSIIEHLKEELREIGVAFEKLQDAAVKAAATLKAFSDAVPQENAEIVANYLESAAGRAE